MEVYLTSEWGYTLRPFGAAFYPQMGDQKPPDCRWWYADGPCKMMNMKALFLHFTEKVSDFLRTNPSEPLRLPKGLWT
jgi:hypothetical protein